MTVNNVVTVNSDVEMVFPVKYLVMSHCASLCLASHTAYSVRALMVCRGPSANRTLFQPSADTNQLGRLSETVNSILLNTKKTKKAKSSLVFVELLIWSKKQKWS
jgi:hypothetical protein